MRYRLQVLAAVCLLCPLAWPCLVGAVDVQKVAGGSAVTNLGYGIAVNKESSLQRTWYVVNSPECAIQLAGAGIKTEYGDRSYSYVPAGDLTTSGDVAAFEIRFLLFDVFGEHMRTLGGTEVRDLSTGSNLALSETGSWHAWENDVSAFLTSVAFVSLVRLHDGTVWRADMGSIQTAIANVKLELTAESLDLSKDE